MFGGLGDGTNGSAWVDNIERMFYRQRSPMTAYAELHCHTNFSFLDGASAPDELAERALELGLTGLGITDHQGLYGVVRASTTYEELGLRPVLGIEVELRDSIVPDPDRIVVPRRRSVRRGGRRRDAATVRADEPGSAAHEGEPDRPRPDRARLPGHREAVKEDQRGIGERQRGPHLLLLARDAIGYRSLCRLVSRANLAGTKAMPRFEGALLAEHSEGLVALSGCREGEIARRLRAGDREGARAAAAALSERYGADGFHLELSHHRLPDDDWLVTETVALADELALPVVVTNDVHYAAVEGREFQDVLTAIRHGRTLDTLADLRRPDGESFLKSAEEMAALPPGDGSLGRDVARAWSAGMERAVELARRCRVDLGFEQYRFPGFPVPSNETPFSYLSELCWTGAKKRYHPLTAAVVNRLAHELDVIERAGLAEFFLICWDLMRFAKEQGIPAQGRGSAASSIVAYTLGISRVEPIQHNLLFERFINEGRTTYPDVDIDFSSERREEVIQYVYKLYGPEHTGMVCNLVTYRARSAVREVGVALGFPRPLVDRVAKALETYDSVMVRRDLEADGGFAEFFHRPGEGLPVESGAAAEAELRGPRRRDGAAQQARAAGREGAAVAPAARTDGSRTRRARSRGSTEIPLGADAGAALPDRISMPSLSGGHGGGEDPSGESGSKPATLNHAGAGALAGRSSFASPANSDGINVGARKGEHGAELPDALAPRTAIRPSRHGDDEGGPGDTPASVAWLRGGRGTGYAADRDRLVAPALIDGRQVDPESGQVEPAPRRADGPAPPGRGADRLGRPNHWDPPAPSHATMGRGGDSKVARVEPEEAPQRAGRLHEGHVRLGALARVLCPDRRLPAPPLDPLAAGCS